MLKLEVEVAPDASLPWPPPLQEAVMENIYVAYITTPPPTPHTVSFLLYLLLISR